MAFFGLAYFLYRLLQDRAGTHRIDAGFRWRQRTAAQEGDAMMAATGQVQSNTATSTGLATFYRAYCELYRRATNRSSKARFRVVGDQMPVVVGPAGSES